MSGWLWLLLISAGLLALHLLACWMESKGWIYWTKSGGYSTRAGNAMLEIQQLLEPEKKNVIIMKSEKQAKRDSTASPEPPLSPPE